MENDEEGGRRQGVDPTTAAQQHLVPTFKWNDTLAAMNLSRDSGYESESEEDPSPNSAVALASGEKNRHSKTGISTGTTVAQAVAQKLISELCNGIYGRIQRHVGVDNQNLLFDVLPDLTKAFALRLAQIDLIYTNREIAHLVYSHHS